MKNLTDGPGKAEGIISGLEIKVNYEQNMQDIPRFLDLQTLLNIFWWQKYNKV